MFSMRLLSVIMFSTFVSTNTQAMLLKRLAAHWRPIRNITTRNNHKPNDFADGIYLSALKNQKKNNTQWLKALMVVATGAVLSEYYKNYQNELREKETEAHTKKWWCTLPQQEKELLLLNEYYLDQEDEKMIPVEECIDAAMARGLVNPNDLVTKNGNTLLMLACQNNKPDVARSLLGLEGVKINTKNRDGMTALGLAIASGSPELVAMILTHDGVDIFSEDVVHALCQNTNPEIETMICQYQSKTLVEHLRITGLSEV